MKQRIYDLPDGTHLTRPVYVCDDISECINERGNRRYKHYTREEWQARCTLRVSVDNHGHGYNPDCDGMLLCYFRFGFEGNPREMLGDLGETERDTMRAYAAQHREEHRDTSRRYRQEHHDDTVESCRIYNQRNQEKMKKYFSDYYQNNREEHLRKSREYYLKNIEARREYGRKYYEQKKSHSQL